MVFTLHLIAMVNNTIKIKCSSNAKEKDRNNYLPFDMYLNDTVSYNNNS